MEQPVSNKAEKAGCCHSFWAKTLKFRTVHFLLTTILLFFLICKLQNASEIMVLKCVKSILDESLTLRRSCNTIISSGRASHAWASSASLSEPSSHTAAVSPPDLPPDRPCVAPALPGWPFATPFRPCAAPSLPG